MKKSIYCLFLALLIAFSSAEAQTDPGQTDLGWMKIFFGAATIAYSLGMPGAPAPSRAELMPTQIEQSLQEYVPTVQILPTYSGKGLGIDNEISNGFTTFYLGVGQEAYPTTPESNTIRDGLISKLAAYIAVDPSFQQRFTDVMNANNLGGFMGNGSFTYYALNAIAYVIAGGPGSETYFGFDGLLFFVTNTGLNQTPLATCSLVYNFTSPPPANVTYTAGNIDCNVALPGGNYIFNACTEIDFTAGFDAGPGVNMNAVIQ